MRKLPSEAGSDGDEKAASNPFASGNDRGDAKLDPTKKWAVSGTDKAKYDTKFYSLQLNAGKASGAQVMNIMLQSGLGRGVLRSIWDLSHIDQDGKMVRALFSFFFYSTPCRLGCRGVCVMHVCHRHG